MEEPGRYRVAAIQFEPQLGAKGENIARLLDLTAQAAQAGARLIVHPEMATTGYCWYDREEIAPYVEPIPGPTTERFTTLAKEYDCYIVLGLPEVVSRTRIYYNSSALVGPDGVIGVYRKAHSFISEPKWAKDGDLGFPVWDTPLGRIGMLICADAAPFESARLLALRGADVLCFPTNWLSGKTPPASWPTRALENGCYLITANRYGLERTVQFAGGSCVIDPDGSVQAECGDGEAIVYAEVDLERARDKTIESRCDGEKFAARRPELYENLTLNSYLFNPQRFHGLYGHRPLPAGRRSQIGVVQFQPRASDPAGNLALIEQQLQTRTSATDLIVFPEYALTGRPADGNAAAGIALAEDAPELAKIVALARRYDTQIVVGFAEQSNGAFYSTALLVGHNGELARYRKAHVVGGERDWLTPGDERPPVIDLPVGRLGLLLGTDLWFPEICRALASEGCDLLVIPAGPGLPAVRPVGPAPIPLAGDGVVEADLKNYHLGRQRV